MTSRIEEAFSAYAEVLNSKFKATRAAVSDSDVKGGLNEANVRDFLSGVVPHMHIAHGCQILDIKDKVSDECDICVCNENQFFLLPEGGVVISEGVDFVVQVKAKLTDGELNRAIKNCRSVKARVRKTNLNDRVRGHGVLPSENYECIPYIVFAFSSEITLETLTEKIDKKTKPLNCSEEIDAIFVLDRGITLVNCKKTFGHKWTNPDGSVVEGWCALDTKKSTLLEFVRFCLERVPRVVWEHSPISGYLPLSKYRGYMMNGTSKKKTSKKKTSKKKASKKKQSKKKGSRKKIVKK